MGRRNETFVSAGNVEQAIILCLGMTNNPWFHPLLDFLLCIPNKAHIHFLRPDGTTSTFGFPLAFIYLGHNEQKFIEVFSQYGKMVRAIRL